MMRTQRRLTAWAMLLAALAVSVAGCVGPTKVEKQGDDFFSKIPAATLSQNIVHSPSGDMTARLPNEWVTIDVDTLEDPEVFAVACNPDYTMSVMLSEVPLDSDIRAGFERNGLRGLLDASYARRQRRMSGRAQGMQSVELFAIGLRKFGAYSYSTDSMQTITRVAVFFTNYHLYECAITHLNFGVHDLPDEATVREVHQIVLGGIEW